MAPRAMHQVDRKHFTLQFAVARGGAPGRFCPATVAVPYPSWQCIPAHGASPAEPQLRESFSTPTRNERDCAR